MSDKLVIPRLKVKQDWYVGLHPDPVDRSHPDVHDDLLVQEALINSIIRKSSSANLPEYIYAAICSLVQFFSFCLCQILCHLFHLII